MKIWFGLATGSKTLTDCCNMIDEIHKPKWTLTFLFLNTTITSVASNLNSYAIWTLECNSFSTSVSVTLRQASQIVSPMVRSTVKGEEAILSSPTTELGFFRALFAPAECPARLGLDAVYQTVQLAIVILSSRGSFPVLWTFDLLTEASIHNRRLLTCALFAILLGKLRKLVLRMGANVFGLLTCRMLNVRWMWTGQTTVQ